MNILHISASLPFVKDGIGDCAALTFREFKVDGVKILLTTDNPKIREYVNLMDIPNVYYFKNWRFSLSNIKTISSIIKKHSINCVFIDYPGKAYGKELFICLFAAFLRVRVGNVNLRLHEFNQARRLRKLVILPLVLFSNKVFVPGFNEMKTLQKIFKNKINKTYIGSNVPVIESLDSDNRNRKNINISYYGFIYPSKGFDELLVIFSDIKKRCPQADIKFTVIGEFDFSSKYKKYHRSLKEMVEEMGLSEFIEFTGYLEKKESSYQISQTDFAILPFCDGLSLRRGSFLAYFTHNIPVITSYGDEESVSLFSDNEYVFMAKNHDEMVDKACLWINNVDQLKKCKNDNKKYNEKFNWSMIVGNLMEHMKNYNKK